MDSLGWMRLEPASWLNRYIRLRRFHAESRLPLELVEPWDGLPPRWIEDRLRVLFDEAHRNHHTAGGRYTPFANLIRNDGYNVQPNRDAFAAERLAGLSVLVIVCAKGGNDTEN